MDRAIHDKFMALVRDEGLADPSWILSLDEFDEPPLFTRDAHVEFLRPLPTKQRLIVTLEVLLATMEMVANEAARGAPERVFYVCATLSDFDSWRAGEKLIPRPAIFVDPKDEERALRLMEPWSEDAIEIAQTLTFMGPGYADRYCIGELSPEVFDPETARVYLGWRTNPSLNVKSVGAEIGST